MKVSKQCVPLFIGLTVLAIGISFGYNCGYAINPARDLAPRLFTLISGWGVSVLTYPSIWWCLVPLLATRRHSSSLSLPVLAGPRQAKSVLQQAPAPRQKARGGISLRNVCISHGV